MNRISKGISAGIAAVAAAALAMPGAFGQAKRAQFGSVAVKAPHSVMTLNKENVTVELDGGVSVQTDTGDILTAGRVTLLLANNPATKKLDAKTVTAAGNVKLKTVQTIRPEAGGPAYKRVIHATADNAVLNKFDNKVALTGNVTVTAQDPTMSAAWRNAATASMDLTTKTVEARAANGEVMVGEFTPKG